MVYHILPCPSTVYNAINYHGKTRYLCVESCDIKIERRNTFYILLEKKSKLSLFHFQQNKYCNKRLLQTLRKFQHCDHTIKTDIEFKISPHDQCFIEYIWEQNAIFHMIFYEI